MGRIVFGAIATEIRGSVGGTTFQGNAYGFTVKNKANMARLQSVAQNELHRLITFVSQYWLTLTQAQRDHWTAFAISHPVSSNNNPAAVLSGYNYFLKYNLIRGVGGVVPMDEPTDGTLSFPSFSPSLWLDSGHLWFNLNAGGPYMDMAYNFYLSPPTKKTQGYRQSSTRYIENANMNSSWQDCNANFLKFFGKLPSVGDRIFAEVQPWGQYIPQIPQSQYFILTVT